MKKQALFVLYFLFIVRPQCVTATSSEPEAAFENLRKSVSRVVETSGIPTTRLGIVVADLSGEIVYQNNKDKKFIPASLTKIATAAAVLERLPTGHQFKTEILATAKVDDGSVLEGDIYLRGGGDPGFVSESMWFLVNEFVRSGIREIKGDIIVDDTRFDAIRFDPSRDQSRVDRAYDSPIGAMTFNWSAANIYVRPGKKNGDRVRVYADPQNDYIKIKNKAKTLAKGRATKLSVNNLGSNPGDQGELVEVSGGIAVGAPEFVAYKSISRPEIWAGFHLREFLKQRGIRVSGTIRSGATPRAAIVLAEHKGKPVGALVEGMMKFSNNYIAEILTKNLAVEVKGAPGTMEKGVEAIRAYLAEKGLKDFVLKNPSGLSRANRFSADDFLKILIHVNQNFKIYPEFLSSLAIAGVDGTLKRRLGRESTNGHIRAKTGHLSGVAGLGGYVSAPQGQIYAFVFLYNGGADEAYKSKDLFDKILMELLKERS